MVLLWWCFDDHLATALNAPGVGHLPWWVVLLLAVCTANVSYRSD